MTEEERWHWQEPGTAWRGIGVYHVTLTVPSREPLLGSLVIPDGDPALARIERTALGNAVVDELYVMCRHYPEVRILQFCLMPDHLHAVVYVTKVMKASIRSVVRGYWQGVKKLGRAYSQRMEAGGSASVSASASGASSVSASVSGASSVSASVSGASSVSASVSGASSVSAELNSVTMDKRGRGIPIPGVYGAAVYQATVAARTAANHDTLCADEPAAAGYQENEAGLFQSAERHRDWK